MTRKIKKSLALILSILMLMSVVPMNIAFAAEQVDGDFVHEPGKGVQNTTTTVTGYKGTEKNIEIPDKLGGYTVTMVKSGKDKPFKANNTIESVKIPDTVTKISDNAFLGCENLTTVIICANDIEIGKKAFDGCTNLTQVEFAGSPEQWDAIVAKIGTGNDALTSSTITYYYGYNCEANGHIYGEWETENRVHERVCQADETHVERAECADSAEDNDCLCDICEAFVEHTLADGIAKAETCTEDSWEAYEYCTVEGCEYTTKTVNSASGHEFGEAVAAVPATCVDPGMESYKTCVECGKFFAADETNEFAVGLEDTTSFVIEINPDNHNYRDWYRYNENILEHKTYCLNTGCNKVKIESCSDSATDNDCVCDTCGAFVAHTFEGANCTTAGVCSVCEAVGEIAADNHDMETVDAKAETCTDIGWNEHTRCKREGCTYKESYNEIPAKGHNLKKVDAKPVTCTVNGNKEYYKCEDCDAVFADEELTGPNVESDYTIYAKGHKLDSKKAKAPTCTEPGNNFYVFCMVCDALFTDKDLATPIEKLENTVRPANGHTWSATYVDGKDGKHYNYCTVEGCSALKDDSATDHSWDDGVVTKDPTCTEKGTMLHKCTVENCTAEKTEPIKENGHTEVYYTQEPNCTEPGKIGEKWCTVCEQFTAEAEIIPATGHAWVGVDENYKAATCTTDASGERKCSVCGLQEVDTTLAHHTYPEAWTPKKPATCTKEGEEIKLCEVCKTAESVISNPIPALNHVGFDTYVIDENEVAGTCTTEATWDKVTRCAGCDNAISSVAMTGTTDPTNHIDIETDEAYDTYVIDKNEVAGTCKAEATWDKVTYCGGCDAKLSTEPKTGTKDATNHVDGVRKVDEDIVAGTCTAVKTWNEVTYCNGCNAELDSVAKTGAMDAANHKDVETGEAYETYAIDENEVAGTCKAEATWDKVTYCGGCDAKLSTEPKTGTKDEDNHVDGVSKVDENIVAGTCKAEKTWNEVTYCNGCETVLNTVAKKGEKDAANHVDGVLKVEENVVAGTCKTERTWNEVTYCKGCDAKLSTEPKTGAKDTTNHVGGVHTEIKNIVEGTCTAAKTWNEVKYCNDCNAELDSVAKTGNKNPANHVGGVRKVEENVVAGTCKTERKWNEVTYCKGCNDKLKTEPKTGSKDLDNHKWSEEVTEHYRECENGCNAKLPVDHSYEGDFRTIKEATCKEAGLKVKYCKYCHNDVEFEIAKTNNHTDNNKDYKCDLCEIELEKPEQDEAGTDNNKPAQNPSANCSCSCHKSGMANLVFRIILFFQKLFGANKTCDCGKSHY